MKVRSRANGRKASARGTSATAAQLSRGTRRSIATTSCPSARLYGTVVPSWLYSACVAGVGSLVRMSSAELAWDRMISLPSSVIR